MKIALLLLALLVAVYGSGCALNQLQEESIAREQRISMKTNELRRENARGRELLDEQRRIQEEKEELEQSFNSLQEDLDRAKKEIAGLKAKTEKQLAAKERTNRKAQELQGQINAVKKADHVPTGKKQEEIQRLREEIRGLLEVQIHQ